MSTNSVLLLVVVAIAALLMAGAIGWVVIKTRAPKCRVAVRRDSVEKDAPGLERDKLLADEFVKDARSAPAAHPTILGPPDRTPGR